MSIKNPLPGHQYGTSEPGYWYPREERPRRRQRSWDKRTLRKLAGWTIALVVIGGSAWASHAHQRLASAPLATSSPAAGGILSAPAPTASATTRPVAPAGYPGAQAGDQPATANGSATIQGVAVTAGTWTRMSVTGGQPALCLDASLVNRTGSTISYSLQDWSLQSPTGDVHPPMEILYDTGTQANPPPALLFGQLIPGGSTSGRLCFPDPRTAGTYVAAFHPEIPGAGRAIWLVKEA